jgi:HEPN domain-containing protein
MLGHKDWLELAWEDLNYAKLGLPKKYFRPLVYHCQQAAEKALKGYLVFKKHEIMKSHDLVKLLGVCALFDQEFAKLYPAAAFMNQFSSKFRYPTEYDIPDEAEAKLAIRHARGAIRLVEKKIAEPECGQKNIFL